MSLTPTCPRCGLRITIRDEMCPRCLLQANFGAKDESSVDAVTSHQGLVPGSADESLPPGQVIDRKYRIERRLGKGGMGSVYLATHMGTKRTVAIKLISSEWTERPEFQTRFRREAEALGRLRHPNVVNVTDFGLDHFQGRNLAYLVMEYLDGVTLAAFQAEHGPVPVSTALDIIEQVASALETAHRSGVVHRDLKPENIWIESDRLGGFNARVLDFGIAKMAGPAPPLAPAPSQQNETLEMDDVSTEHNFTQRGKILGTPAYMSPEQCRGEPLDGRSDVYSLGVITYLLLAGELPFTGSSVELMQQHLHSAPPPLHKRKHGISKAVSCVVSLALEKDANNRPHSAVAFASLLRTNAESERSFLPKGRQLSSSLPAFFFLVFVVNSIMGTILGGLILIGLTQLPFRGVWLDFCCLAGMFAALLMIGNCMKAAWRLALEEVVAQRQLNIPVVRVLGAWLRQVPGLLLQHFVVVLTTAPPFAKCLWPIVQVTEGRVSTANRSSYLTENLRNPAAALTVRIFVFAASATAYCLIVVPTATLLGSAGDRWDMSFLEAATASMLFSIMSTATLASFPFLYLRARTIRNEAPEPPLPATNTPAFPGNRIPLLTRSTKLFVFFGALVIAASFYLQAKGTSPEKWRSADELIHSAELGKANNVRRLLAEGVDVNAQIRPWTPLTRATLFGQRRVVDVLLNAGADVNFEDQAVGSPAYLATAARRNEILSNLLQRGADPNSTPSWGLTPLMVAAMQGNEEAVRLLLRYGADKMRRSKDGRLASDLAKEEGHFAIAELLK